MKKADDQNICIRQSRNEEQIARCKAQVSKVGDYLYKTAQILALGGNEVRLKILLLLQAEQKLCVCDLGEILEMKTPAISQHLRKLKDAGLVLTEREGTVIYYSITPPTKPTIEAILGLIVQPVLI